VKVNTCIRNRIPRPLTAADQVTEKSAVDVTVAAAKEARKCHPELGGHGIVKQRIDSAVGVDCETTTQQEPAVLVASICERVVDDVGSVWQPQRRERCHDHNQHLYYLSTVSSVVIWNQTSLESDDLCQSFGVLCRYRVGQIKQGHSLNKL